MKSEKNIQEEVWIRTEHCKELLWVEVMHGPLALYVM